MQFTSKFEKKNPILDLYLMRLGSTRNIFVGPLIHRASINLFIYNLKQNLYGVNSNNLNKNTIYKIRNRVCILILVLGDPFMQTMDSSSFYMTIPVVIKPMTLYDERICLTNDGCINIQTEITPYFHPKSVLLCQNKTFEKINKAW